MHIVSIALCGPSVRSLTRPFGPPSPRGRGSKKSLSRWERGWGEGQTAKHVHLQHTSDGRGNADCRGTPLWLPALPVGELRTRLTPVVWVFTFLHQRRSVSDKQ